MRIEINEDLCEGNGRCEAACPTVFRVGEDDCLTVLVEQPDPASWEAVEEAARLCPRAAILLHR